MSLWLSISIHHFTIHCSLNGISSKEHTCEKIKAFPYLLSLYARLLLIWDVILTCRYNYDVIRKACFNHTSNLLKHCNGYSRLNWLLIPGLHRKKWYENDNWIGKSFFIIKKRCNLGGLWLYICHYQAIWKILYKKTKSYCLAWLSLKMFSFL